MEIVVMWVTGSIVLAIAWVMGRPANARHGAAMHGWRFATRVVNRGSKSMTTASVPTRNDFEFVIRHEDRLDRALKSHGIQELQTGDSAFDAQFFVESEDLAVSEFLAHAKVRQTLQAGFRALVARGGRGTLRVVQGRAILEILHGSDKRAQRFEEPARAMLRSFAMALATQREWRPLAVRDPAALVSRRVKAACSTVPVLAALGWMKSLFLPLPIVGAQVAATGFTVMIAVGAGWLIGSRIRRTLGGGSHWREVRKHLLLYGLPGLLVLSVLTAREVNVYCDFSAGDVVTVRHAWLEVGQARRVMVHKLRFGYDSSPQLAGARVRLAGFQSSRLRSEAQSYAIPGLVQLAPLKLRIHPGFLGLPWIDLTSVGTMESSN